MSFAIDEVFPRLVAWGLMDERAVVEGDLEIRDAARRNRNLRIDRRRGPSYLIKQPEVDSRATLRAEAGFYDFCRREPRLAALRPLLAPVHGFYPHDEALVLEIVGGARSWWGVYRDAGAPNLPRGPARSLGVGLATVHAAFRNLEPASDAYLAELTSEVPRVFGVHRPSPKILRHLSPAKRRLLEIVQTDAGLVAGLDAAAAGWRIETVIHGDVRSANVLMVAAADSEADIEVRLIDWELARHGDPAWDLAGGFQELLLFWLLSMSLSPDLDPGERIASASWPLTAVQTAVRDLWRGYVATSGSRADGELLQRAVGMTGVRLIQSAWEHSSEAERLSSLVVLLVQLAANVLRDPQSAASGLLGLPAET